MFILELYQDGISTELGLFDTIEEGRKFVSQLKGYKFEEVDGFEYETIKLGSISDYMELEINGNIVPLTKFMFTEDGDIEVYWKEIPNLSKKRKRNRRRCNESRCLHSSKFRFKRIYRSERK